MNYRVIETRGPSGILFVVQQLEEIKHFKWFGLKRTASTYQWIQVPKRIYGVVSFQIHEKTEFDNKEDAILFCDYLINRGKYKEVYHP